MGLMEDIQGSTAGLQDDFRSIALDSAAKFYLLKREGQTKRFVIVLEVTGWFYRWDDIRLQMLVGVSTTDTDFGDKIAQSDYAAVGVPDADGAIEVFVINPDRKDISQPDGTSPFWKMWMNQEPEERFTPPEPDPEPEPEPEEDP